MNKICFILPGYFEQVNEKRYAGVKKILKENDIKAVPVKVQWKYRTFDHWVPEFIEMYDKTVKKNDKVFALGFSFGAVAAYLATEKRSFDALILCSLSPFFKEDLAGLANDLRAKGYKTTIEKEMGKKRMENFKRMVFTNCAKNPAGKTYLLFGSKELSSVLKRAQEACSMIEGANLIEATGAEHDISDENYLKEIERVIKKL